MEDIKHLMCLCARGFNFAFIAVLRPGSCFPCCQLPFSHSRPLDPSVLRMVVGQNGQVSGPRDAPVSEPASDCPQRGEAARGEHIGIQNSASFLSHPGPGKCVALDV